MEKFEFYDEVHDSRFAIRPEDLFAPAHDRQKQYPRTESDVEADYKTTQAEVDNAVRRFDELANGAEPKPRSIDK